MFRFMCFPVIVNPVDKTVNSRPSGLNGQVFEAQDYDNAIAQAGNHIALFEGEQIAVVKVGRVLSESATNTLPLNQAGG